MKTDLKITSAPFVDVTLIEAAQCHTRTGIRLYFQDNAPLATHTLACAAQELVGRLLKQSGEKPVRELLLDSVVESRRAEVRAALNRAANFLKHGPDRNASSPVLEQFSDDSSLWDLLSAAAGLDKIGRGIAEGKILNTWVALAHPDILKPPYAELSVLAGMYDKPRAEQKEIGRSAISRFDAGLSPFVEYARG